MTQGGAVVAPLVQRADGAITSLGIVGGIRRALSGRHGLLVSTRARFPILEDEVGKDRGAARCFGMAQPVGCCCIRVVPSSPPSVAEATPNSACP